MIIADDINTRIYALPNTIKSYVMYSDDRYTIVINSNLSQEMQSHAYLHELKHIINGDYAKTNVDFIEIRAHGL